MVFLYLCTKPHNFYNLFSGSKHKVTLNDLKFKRQQEASEVSLVRFHSLLSCVRLPLRFLILNFFLCLTFLQTVDLVPLLIKIFNKFTHRIQRFLLCEDESFHPHKVKARLTLCICQT